MIVGFRVLAGEKIKLEERPVSEILSADTVSELGADASDIED